MGGAAVMVGRKAARQTQLAVTNTPDIWTAASLWETQRTDECERTAGTQVESWRREALGLLTVLWYVRHVFTPGGFSDGLFPFHCLAFSYNSGDQMSWNIHHSPDLLEFVPNLETWCINAGKFEYIRVLISYDLIKHCCSSLLATSGIVGVTF